MKSFYFSSYTILFALFGAIMAAPAPWHEVSFVTDQNAGGAEQLPKYDTSGEDLELMRTTLRGDWVRMSYPPNLPRLAVLPTALVPLTASDYLSFGVLNGQLYWAYKSGLQGDRRGFQSHHASSFVEYVKNQAPYIEYLKNKDALNHYKPGDYAHCGQFAGYWRSTKNPAHMIRIIIFEESPGGAVNIRARILTKEEEEWSKRTEFVSWR